MCLTHCNNNVVYIFVPKIWHTIQVSKHSPATRCMFMWICNNLLSLSHFSHWVSFTLYVNNIRLRTINGSRVCGNCMENSKRVHLKHWFEHVRNSFSVKPAYRSVFDCLLCFSFSVCVFFFKFIFIYFALFWVVYNLYRPSCESCESFIESRYKYSIH